ncbi:MAG TPA: DUF3108 domain-containing protein [Stellaceae bacterium]|nr:DUF3108 domain-containing protein [Stellaceae bacterium]
MRALPIGLVVLSVLLAHGAAAGEVAALYRAYWAGLPAGEISLALHDDGAGYRDEITISTEGLPRFVTRFRGSASSEGRVAAPLPAPSYYEATYDLRKRRDRRLSMRFTRDGAAAVAERGPGDTSRKPPLALRYRTGVLDPLSALTAIRSELRRGNRGSFTVPVYDGSRRFDVRVRVLPQQPGERSLRLELTLAPIAGFKGETSDDGDPDDAPRPVTLTISDDRRLMPLMMRVSLYYLPLVVELSRWCDETPCRQ